MPRSGLVQHCSLPSTWQRRACPHRCSPRQGLSATVATAALAGPGAGEAFVAEADFSEHCRLLCTEALEPTDLRWTFEIRDGNPADELMKAAEDHNAAFVVVGRQGHHILGGLLAGSVSQRLLHHARRPLLVIPAA